MRGCHICQVARWGEALQSVNILSFHLAPRFKVLSWRESCSVTRAGRTGYRGPLVSHMACSPTSYVTSTTRIEAMVTSRTQVCKAAASHSAYNLHVVFDWIARPGIRLQSGPLWPTPVDRFFAPKSPQASATPVCTVDELQDELSSPWLPVSF